MRVEDLNEYGLTTGAPTPVGQQTNAASAKATKATPTLSPGQSPAQAKAPAPAAPAQAAKKPTIAKAKELEVDFEFPDKNGNVVKVITPSSANKNQGVVVQNQKTQEFYTLNPEDNIVLPQVEMEEDAFSNSLKRITSKKGKLSTTRKGHRHLQFGNRLKKMKKLIRAKRITSKPIFEINIDDPDAAADAVNQSIQCSFEAEFIWQGLPSAEHYDAGSAQRAVAEEISQWVNKHSLVKNMKAGDYYQGSVESEQDYWRVEDDPSVESATGIPSEIISPMYETPATMLGELANLLKFFQAKGVETNTTTSLHVTMGWTREESPADKLKMGLLLGDRFLLQQFSDEGQEKISQVENIIRVLHRNADNPNALHSLAKSLEPVAETGKFSTVNFRTDNNEVGNQLIEFRVVTGDDWHTEFNKITDLVTKYSAIMIAGHDKTKYNRDYITAVDNAIHGVQKAERQLPVPVSDPVSVPREETTFSKFNSLSLEEQLAILENIDEIKLNESWKRSKISPKARHQVKEKKIANTKMFEGSVPDNSSVRQINKILAEPLLGSDLRGQMAAYAAVPVPAMIKEFRQAIAVGGKNYDLRNIFKSHIRGSVHPDVQQQINLKESILVESRGVSARSPGDTYISVANPDDILTIVDIATIPNDGTLQYESLDELENSITQIIPSTALRVNDNNPNAGTKAAIIAHVVNADSKPQYWVRYLKSVAPGGTHGAWKTLRGYKYSVGAAREQVPIKPTDLVNDNTYKNTKQLESEILTNLKKVTADSTHSGLYGVIEQAINLAKINATSPISGAAPYFNVLQKYASEYLGPFALIDGDNTSGQTTEMLAAYGLKSLKGAQIMFPDNIAHPLVDSIIKTKNNIEIGISSKAHTAGGAASSITGIYAQLTDDIRSRYPTGTKIMEMLATKSAVDGPISVALMLNLIDKTAANELLKLDRSSQDINIIKSPSLRKITNAQGVRSDTLNRPDYRVFYHALAAVALRAFNAANDSEEFRAAMLESLNNNKFLMLMTNGKIKGNDVTLEYYTKFPAVFDGSPKLVNKNYFATGQKGRVGFKLK